VTAACVLCGSSEHRVVKREEGHSVVRCAQCGLLFVSPKPPLSALRQAYADGHAQSVDPGGQRRNMRYSEPPGRSGKPATENAPGPEVDS
jgi:transcription elongation factor Elf1